MERDSQMPEKKQQLLDPSIKPYQVFINHRGPDVKETLASHIYRSLNNKGLHVFYDKTEFQPGQELFTTIKEAIRTCSVHIAIFSPRYAESPWCLDELCLMLESGARIIPVFYHVAPVDLKRLQKDGVYADALAELQNKMNENEKRYQLDRVMEWRNALKRMSNISGLDLNSNEFNGDEGKLVECLVNQVSQHVRQWRKKAFDGFVGLDEAVTDFSDFLSKCEEKRQNAKFVGIVGIEGSGKTALVEEFWYRQGNHFDRSSLLWGVRNASGRDGLQNLQRQLLKDLTNSNYEINNRSEGKQILKDRVSSLCQGRSLKLLIVIDGVDHKDHLDALLLKEQDLGSGSLVVVTSRDKAVLKISGISTHYQIKPLGLKHARQLLCRTAFDQIEPIPGMEGLVETTLMKCGGVPLFLKAIGLQFCLYGNNNKDDCKRILDMISQIAEIQNASYGVLSEEEKHIFLDVACFFVGMKEDSAIRILGGSGSKEARALKNLEYRCLLETDDHNRLKMPDYLCDLGRMIAENQLYRSPDLPCRLWRPNYAPNHAKSLFGDLLPEMTKIRGTHFGNTEPTIELLDVNGDLCDASIRDRLKDLVWFRWKNCPKTIFPQLQMKSLRVLQLVDGNLENLGNPAFQLLAHLREIKIKNCRNLVAIPPTIKMLQDLEKLTLKAMVGLQTLPAEFAGLRALKHLELIQCEGLESLPDCFGQLTNLQHINFSGCLKLTQLPVSLRKLKKLKYLDLRDCQKLKIDADMFAEINCLEQLNFENCKMLLKLPNRTTCQESMWKLNLLGTSLEALPDDIDGLKKLQQLLIGSPCLTRLPSSLEKMKWLKELVLCNCSKLSVSPTCIGHLILSHGPRMQIEEKTQVETLYVYISQLRSSGVKN